MENRNDLHVKITHHIKKMMVTKKVILPAVYEKAYIDISKKHKLKLTPQELLHEEVIDEQMLTYILSLSKCADAAIIAVEQKDEEKIKLILEEMKELKNELDSLKEVAYIDTLTGAFNRRWFENNYLDDENSLFSKDCNLVFIDLNRLKRINDTFGHTVGDKVIRYLASKLKELDYPVIRHGGDEFMLMFDDKIETKEIEKIMNNTFKFFSKTAFKHEDKNFKVTFAYGHCPCKRDDQLSNALDIADKAMYKFKVGCRSTDN